MHHLLDHLIAHAHRQPDDSALIATGPGGTFDVMTYRELHDAVARFTDELRSRLSTPAIVPILSSKSINCVIAMLSVLASGSAFAVLNRKLKPPQLNAIIEAAKSPLGIIEHGVVLPAMQPDEAFAKLPWLTIHRVETDDQTALNVTARPADSVGCCLFTSGSTGRPKGVLIAEQDLHRRAVAEAELYGLSSRDVLLCVLPFSFDVGLNQLLSSLVAGSTLVLTESWLPVDMLRLTAKFGVTGISGVPSVWNGLIQSTLRFDTRGDHASLRYVTVSGGDLPVERLNRLAEAVGNAGIFKTYGQSETFRSTALRTTEFANHTTSVGRAFGDAKIYIIRPDRSPADANEPGEIIHTGPGTMLGYLDGPADCLRPNPFHGPNDPNPQAIFTGDTGHLDDDGFLYVHGRRDAMLKIAGNRVYPKEIIDQLLAIDGVAEAEVCGVKDTDGETQLFVFVALADGATQTATELRRQLAGRVPSYMVSKTITLLDALPKTANGKIDRPALMDRCSASGTAVLSKEAI